MIKTEHPDPDGPADLDAIRADDRMLDLIVATGPFGDDEAALILARWRREVRTRPTELPELTCDVARAAIQAGHRRCRQELVVSVLLWAAVVATVVGFVLLVIASN